MPFLIRNREVERLTRELARAAGTGLTEAVHLAVANELERRRDACRYGNVHISCAAKSAGA